MYKSDVDLTASECENKRSLWGYIYSYSSRNVLQLEVDMIFLHLRAFGRIM